MSTEPNSETTQTEPVLASQLADTKAKLASATAELDALRVDAAFVSTILTEFRSSLVRSIGAATVNGHQPFVDAIELCALIGAVLNRTPAFKVDPVASESRRNQGVNIGAELISVGMVWGPVSPPAPPAEAPTEPIAETPVEKPAGEST